MKKIINVLSLVIFTALLSLSLVSCGVPHNLVDASEKMKAAGYDVDDGNVSLNTSGTYLALRAYGEDGYLALTAAYFVKSSSKADAEKFYANIQKQYQDKPEFKVKMKEVGNFVLVYYGRAQGIKDFER